MTMKTSLRFKQTKQAWLETKRDNCNNVIRLGVCEADLENPSAMNVQSIGRGWKPMPVTHMPDPGGVPAGTSTSCKLGKARGSFTRSSPLIEKIPPISTQRRNSIGELSENVILPPIKVSKISTSAAICATKRASQRQVSRARPESKQHRTSPDHANVFFRSPRQFWHLQKDARSQYFLDNPIVKLAVESLKNGKTNEAGFTSHARVIKRASVKQARYAHPPPPSAKKQTPGQSHTSSSQIDKTKIDTGSSVKTRQKSLSSNDSAIETESVSENPEEGMENEHETQRSPEDYYTNQRIAEWVLKVNGSLFSLTPDPDINNSRKEQDTAIKIVYDGD